MNGLIEIELGLSLANAAERIRTKLVSAEGYEERRSLLIAALWKARLEGVVIALNPDTNYDQCRERLYMDALHELALIENAGI